MIGGHMRKSVLLAVLSLVVVASAFGQKTDVNSAGYVAKLCEHVGNTVDSDKLTSDDNACIGVVNGWVDVMALLPVLMPDGKNQMNLEPTATVGQLARVFYRYVKAHPEYENKPDIYVFCAALLDVKLMKLTPVNTQSSNSDQ
jgi:hypothetical protein